MKIIYYCKDCGIELNSFAKYNKSIRCHSCSAKKLYKEKINPLTKWKGHYSSEHHKIQGNFHCIDCKKLISNYRQRCKSCENKRRLSLGIITRFPSGKDHPNWHGGISLLPYPFEFRKMRQSIRDRDNDICQLCGQEGKDVHHIDYDKNNIESYNLVTLCKRCHGKTNYHNIYWQDYFQLLKESELE